jgi:hypothetical protein
MYSVMGPPPTYVLTNVLTFAYTWNMTTAQVFNADLTKMNAAFEALDALVTYEDGFVAIDETKAPAHMLSAYRLLISYGYANGLI